MALQGVVVGPPFSLFAENVVPLVYTLAMTFVVVMASLLAWVHLVRGRASIVSSVVLVVIGLIGAFWWPISFLFGIEIPIALVQWTTGAALPEWQALLTLAIGLVGLANWRVRGHEAGDPSSD